MLARQKSGGVICYACNKLVSVDAQTCIHCGVSNPGLWGYARTLRRLGYDSGFTSIVVWGCIGLYLLTLADGFESGGNFELLSPKCRSLFIAGAAGGVPVLEYGRWWTLLSSGWLHGDLFHIAFNMLWISRLAPSVTKAYGSARLNIIYTLSIISGGLLTVLVFKYIPNQGSWLTIGASGGVFGLFGALVSYGQRMKDYAIKQSAIIYAVIGFAFGFITPNVNNWGHLGGFLGGYLFTKTPWLDAKKSQKVHDVLIAIACFGLVIICVLFSVLDSIRLLYAGGVLPKSCS